jgi:hypothetical protein
MQTFPLVVRLNEQKTLDMGSYTISDVPDRNAVEYAITPPSVPVFDQVIEYLWAQPEPPYIGYQSRFMSVGFAALAIRWGSYLAALCSPEFTMYAPDTASIPDAQNHSISLIADEEMKRLNIEISANVATLGKIYTEDNMRLYDLMLRAFKYLPMPIKSARPNHELRNQIWATQAAGSLNIYIVQHPEMAAGVLSSFGLEHSESAQKTDIKPLTGEPDRVIGNYLANVGWRNTLIEDYHAGVHLNIDAPLLPAQRRLSKEDERTLMTTMSSNSYEVMNSFFRLYNSEYQSSDPKFHFMEPYPESATAILNAGFLSMYPSDWSTTERSSEVVLRHYAESERI